MPDKEFSTGAVRSTDCDHFDFCSLPIIGMLGLAKNAAVGGVKYGRFNYQLGMPAHEYVNHAFNHMMIWVSGDDSEPHLVRAAWNLLAAEQSRVLEPELNRPHLHGPGYRLTEDQRAHLAEGADERREKRERGEFEELEAWSTESIPAVVRILDQRIEGEINDVMDAAPEIADMGYQDLVEYMMGLDIQPKVESAARADAVACAMDDLSDAEAPVDERIKEVMATFAPRPRANDRRDTEHEGLG